MTEQLSSLEMLEIRLVEKRLSTRCNFAIDLASLLKKWNIFVSQCERGYTDDIDEYRNDLGTRNLLQEIIEGVFITVAEKIRKKLLSVDRRFLEATQPISVPLLQMNNEPTELERTLYFRSPKKSSEMIFK